MSDPAAHRADRAAARWDRPQVYVMLAIGALLAAALAYIGIVDPHRPDSFFPVCPFRLLTGWYCPACGGLRMVHDALHGDVAAAIDDNVVLLIGIPVLAGWVLLRRRRNKWPVTLPGSVTVIITLLVWTAVRNLPGFPLVPALLTR